MKNKTIIRTHCVNCGTQIESEQEILRGKDFLRNDLLEKGDVYPEDPYIYVHLLCENCSMKRGVQTEADKRKN